MVNFEWTLPHDTFLFGIDLINGTTEINDEEQNIKVFSIGLLFFKVSILFFE